MEKRGFLFILAGPLGAGKNTLIQGVIEQVGNLTQMPTATTRPPRPGESENVEHLFISGQEFDQLIQQNAFVEWEMIHGNRYGNLKSTVEQAVNSSKDYIADIDVTGAFSLKKIYLDNVIIIFVLTPSMEILEHRIRQRGNISDDEVRSRLNRAQFEISFMSKCDYVVINDKLEATVEQLRAIILAERCRRDATILWSVMKEGGA